MVSIPCAPLRTGLVRSSGWCDRSTNLCWLEHCFNSRKLLHVFPCFQYTCWSCCHVLFVTFNTLCVVILDRFLAEKIHLRYQELVTVRRTLFLLSSVWIAAAVYTIWDSTHRFSAYNALFLVLTLWCYFQIFQSVRHH